MIIRSRQRDVEIRSAEWGSSWIIPQPGYNWMSAAGVPVTEGQVYGLSAVSSVIRSPSEMVASLPFLTYRDNPRRRAEDTWQWTLFHDDPDDVGSGTYQFFHDINISLEACQNAFVQKAKSRARVEALYVIDPARVRVKRGDDGLKRFDIYVGPGRETVFDLTTDDILHIRGFTPQPGALSGMSLIEMHRDALGNSLALQGFEGDYFRNSGTPPFFFTGARNKEHAQDLITMHNEQHQGVGRQFRAGATWGATDIKTLPISMADAQFIEAKQMSVEEACRIWRWPKELMELSSAQAGQQPRDENAWTARVMKFYMLPRLQRITRAFASDKDLYAGTGLIGEFLTAALERADFVTRMRGYKDARQGGWATANEIRDMENLPPRDDGDTLLVTPTGSAPNPGGGDAGGGQNGSGDADVAASAIGQEMWT